jgi:hypothetical protein
MKKRSQGFGIIQISIAFYRGASTILSGSMTKVFYPEKSTGKIIS